MKISLSPAARVSFGLVSLAVSLLLVFDLLLGIFPNTDKDELKARQRIAESISVQVTTMLAYSDARVLQPVVNELLQRQPSLVSTGLRLANGQLLFASAGHDTTWQKMSKREDGRSRFVVPVSTRIAGGASQEARVRTQWGQMEFAFRPMNHAFLAGSFLSPAFRLVILFSAVAGCVFYLYLRRTFQHLDPSAAVPERVQTAFDAMSEAVLVLDAKARAVMANGAFLTLVQGAKDNVIGRDPATFDWLKKGAEHVSDLPPWLQSMREKAPVTGIPYHATITVDGEISERRLIVNSSPIFDAKENLRGCMVSFSDVTELEEANKQLVILMTELAHSKEQLQVRNSELQRLASVDPMTGALNRRSFFPIFENMFADATENGTHLSFVMADIDKFKTINDVFGHGVGDKVIQKFASILLRCARDSDLVCRYGGEEFCIALPATDGHQARAFAERIRDAVEKEVGPALELEGRRLITASFGVCHIGQGATSASELADQADQALYHSKNNGRNRCTLYSRVVATQQDKEDRRQPAPARTAS